ncbi:MAG: serine hydrolase, partial [Leptospiraceae bacterium]|nr:serine hydrolase [Leptospiraceae bacterium]
EDSSIIALPYYDSENTKGHYTCPDYPNGLARSSVNDLSKFLLMFMNGGEYNGKRILSENTVELMKKQHFEYEEDGEKGRIGLIWYYEDINEDESYLGHEGGEEGVFTRMFYNVEDEVGVILLANLSEANVSPIEDRIYQEYS